MNSPLSTIELHPAGEANAAVIWMHGLGADGNDFVPIVPELRLPASINARFVFPNAEMRAVTINGGSRMRAWYDITSQQLERKADESGVRASALQIEALIAREITRGIPASRIALAGFSQGGVMALFAGLRHAQRLAGLMALSCYLVGGESLAAEASAANKDIPLLMIHGTRDPVVPQRLAESGRDHLAALGYRVDWKSFPMEHSVCAEEVRDLSAFLSRIFS